jgi:hypothetical protein
VQLQSLALEYLLNSDKIIPFSSLDMHCTKSNYVQRSFLVLNVPPIPHYLSPPRGLGGGPGLGTAGQGDGSRLIHTEPASVVAANEAEHGYAVWARIHIHIRCEKVRIILFGPWRDQKT